MLKNKFKIQSKVVQYPGMAAWFFASIPARESAEIKELFGGMKRGFGSLKVIAQVGQTKWKSSIFPDNDSGEYLLPLKAEVRRREKLSAGSLLEFTVEILI